MYPSEDSPQIGTFVKNITNGLISNGFNVGLCSLNRNFSKSALINYLYFYIKCLRFFFKMKYDVVYIHYVSHSSLPFIILKLLFFRFKIISNVHGSDILKEVNVSKFKFFFKKSIAKSILKYSELVVVPSSYYKNIVCNNFPVSYGNVFVSPSGGYNKEIFNVKEISHNTCEAIGFVGRLTTDKGILDFIWICNELFRLYPNLKVYIVGSGPHMNLVQNFSKHKNVTYYPSRTQSQLSEIYNNLNVFLFPTTRKTESLGLVGIEAISCGCPTFAYNVGGPSTYILNGINGFLFDSKNAMLDTLVSYFKHEITMGSKYEIASTVLDYNSTEVAIVLSNKVKGLLYE
jgi:glycosyltransferase involved in cell wall biosynthesis